MSDKPVYEVVSPVGMAPETRSEAARATRGFAPAAPLGDLTGKRIGFIWTNFRNGDILLAAFADLLAKRFAGMEFFNLPSGRTLTWGNYPDRTLPEILREYKIDGLIAAPGC